MARRGTRYRDTGFLRAGIQRCQGCKGPKLTLPLNAYREKLVTLAGLGWQDARERW